MDWIDRQRRLDEIRKQQKEHELKIEYQRRLSHQEQLEHERRMEEDRQWFEKKEEMRRQRFEKGQEKERQAHAEKLLQEQERLRRIAEREAISPCYAATGEKLLGTYDGEFSNGLPKGEGKFYFDNGDVYIGGFLGGKFHGKGKLISKNGEIRYEGDYEVGFLHGIGTYYYENDNKNGYESYQGSFFRGKRQGYGVLVWKNGVSVEGDFVQDLLNGNGVMTWPDGARYEGAYVNGQREGNGKYTYPDGSCYEGEWKAGNRSGKGTFTYVNGWSNIGEWRENKPYNGTFRIYIDNKLEYEGGYVNGKREGSGVLYHSNGDKIYEGFWTKGEYSGEGILHYYLDEELCYKAKGVFEKGKLKNGTYQDGEYIAKGDFDENGLFRSGKLYKNNELFLSGDITKTKFDIHLDNKVFHIKPIFGLVTYIGADDEEDAYIWVKISSLAHKSHGGNDFNNILIEKCRIFGDYVSYGETYEWLYAKDGSGYLKLNPKTNKGELHFTSNQPSCLMQKYGVSFKNNVHFVLRGQFKNYQPKGECVLNAINEKFSEYVTYTKGIRNGKFRWICETDRTVTGSYHNGIRSTIANIEYGYKETDNKYKGEFNECGLPNGLGILFWTDLVTRSSAHISDWSVVKRCTYGIWENGECIKKLSLLAYLFHKIKRMR